MIFHHFVRGDVQNRLINGEEKQNITISGDHSRPKRMSGRKGLSVSVIPHLQTASSSCYFNELF